MTSKERPIEYNAWLHMKSRCYREKDVSYKNYGGRGITVCGQWLNSFENFYKDMGSRPAGMTLDRIDVNGNYTPENCRWATWIQQSANKRVPQNKYIYKINGKEVPRGEALLFYGISVATFKGRLSGGWDHQKAATTPVMKIGRPRK